MSNGGAAIRELLGPLGATFALLVGFAITMTWSALSAGQDAVDLQASSAQQVSWSSSKTVAVAQRSLPPLEAAGQAIAS